MIIFDENGNEVLHTGFRNKNINTEDDLFQVLEEAPKWMKAIHINIDELVKDDKDEGTEI